MIKVSVNIGDKSEDQILEMHPAFDDGDGEIRRFCWSLQIEVLESGIGRRLITNYGFSSFLNYIDMWHRISLNSKEEY